MQDLQPKSAKLMIFQVISIKKYGSDLIFYFIFQNYYLFLCRNNRKLMEHLELQNSKTNIVLSNKERGTKRCFSLLF